MRAWLFELNSEWSQHRNTFLQLYQPSLKYRHEQHHHPIQTW